MPADQPTDHAAPRGTRLAHIGLALPDNAALLPILRDVLGMPGTPIGDSDGARIAAVEAGESLVELLEPATPDSPIAKYLAKRGPGIHHLCLAVDDLEGMLARCRAAGIVLIDEVPRMGAEGKPIAFLHPRSTGGVLIELTTH